MKVTSVTNSLRKHVIEHNHQYVHQCHNFLSWKVIKKSRRDVGCRRKHSRYPSQRKMRASPAFISVTYYQLLAHYHSTLSVVSTTYFRNLLLHRKHFSPFPLSPPLPNGKALLNPTESFERTCALALRPAFSRESTNYVTFRGFVRRKIVKVARVSTYCTYYRRGEECSRSWKKERAPVTLLSFFLFFSFSFSFFSFFFVLSSSVFA